jgi:hypothetical protein
MADVNTLLLGAVSMASLIAGLFFLRFWRDTRDRFFLLFAFSFFVEGINRATLGLSAMSQEQQPFFYMVRLFSFILILLAILGKNRKKAEPTNPPQAQG